MTEVPREIRGVFMYSGVLAYIRHEETMVIEDIEVRRLSPIMCATAVDVLAAQLRGLIPFHSSKERRLGTVKIHDTRPSGPSIYVREDISSDGRRFVWKDLGLQLQVTTAFRWVTVASRGLSEFWITFEPDEPSTKANHV